MIYGVYAGREGWTASIDAMNCHHAIARQIVEDSADYVLGLKGNQGELHEDVKLFFEQPSAWVEFDDEVTWPPMLSAWTCTTPTTTIAGMRVVNVPKCVAMG